MAPKKKEVQKLSLGDFLNDTSFGGSWADEVEDTFATGTGTQPLPPPERKTTYGTSNDRGFHSLRDNLPQKLPERPPFTAHLGNLSYEATSDAITEFFKDCKVVSVRIITDHEHNRPKGFAYAEFADVEGLKTALTRDGMVLEGRPIRVKVADPPRGGFSNRTEVARELDWSQRRGPLTDLPPPPPRGGERRRDFFNDDGKVRDFNNWERRGPLSPVPQPERSLSRDGSRSRNMDRRASPAAWGPGDRHEGSRPPRREFSDRPERQPTAAERDTNWRQSMRPDPPKQSSGESTQAPNSPAPSASQPATRPKLNLAPRTVSAENKDTTAPAPAASSKPNPFGGARPIDTAAREREIEERRAREKREAEERARQERLAREAAAKEAAEKAAAKEAAEKAAAEAAAKANGAQEAATTEAKESPKESEATPSPAPAPAEHKIPIRSREPRDPPKSRATEVSNWRQPAPDRAPSRGGHSGPGPRRGGPRGPRNEGRGGRPNGNAAPQSPSVEQAPSTPIVDEEGWTTVPGKSRRGQSNRPIAS